MADKITCRHYRGIANSHECAIGISYAICEVQSGTKSEWACLSPEHRHLCPSFENFTQTEIDEYESLVNDWLGQIEALEARRPENCPTCSQHIDRMEQVSRCVYARPCGHRLWQGRIPKAWKELL